MLCDTIALPAVDIVYPKDILSLIDTKPAHEDSFLTDNPLLKKALLRTEAHDPMRHDCIAEIEFSNTAPIQDTVPNTPYDVDDIESPAKTLLVVDMESPAAVVPVMVTNPLTNKESRISIPDPKTPNSATDIPPLTTASPRMECVRPITTSYSTVNESPIMVQLDTDKPPCPIRIASVLNVSPKRTSSCTDKEPQIYSFDCRTTGPSTLK
jgi:hypothetical protein